jgi:AcrR family transcriptional regulator
MTTVKNSRLDVVRAAGRLFAERGYHGTSMRDLGRELGLNGSSIYSHVESKESLLVDVVMNGAQLFDRVAAEAAATAGSSTTRLAALVGGHVDVVLDHQDTARTFLNEARSLDDEHRTRVVEARDRYEQSLRDILRSGAESGDFRSDLDIRMATIYILSILNAIDRWYRPDGPLDRQQLTNSLIAFIEDGLRS